MSHIGAALLVVPVSAPDPVRAGGGSGQPIKDAPDRQTLMEGPTNPKTLGSICAACPVSYVASHRKRLRRRGPTMALGISAVGEGRGQFISLSPRSDQRP
jgi:hypothetical protein